MKVARLLLSSLAFLAVGSLGYLVCAQEQLWPTPMVLPKDMTSDPLEGAKGRRGIVTEEVVPAGGQAPIFPDLPMKDDAPPPLPMAVPELSTPMPDAEPTKALIKDGSLKDVIVKPAKADEPLPFAPPPLADPKKDKSGFPEPLPDLFGPPKKDVLPPPNLDPNKDLVVPPLVPEPKKEPFAPPAFPEAKKEPFPPPIVPEPKKDLFTAPITPDLKKEPFPPPIVPEPKKDLFTAPITPDLKKEPFAPPIVPEPKKDLFTAPITPDLKKEPFAPPIMPAPKNDLVTPPIVPEPKKDVIAPPTFPEPKKDLEPLDPKKDVFTAPLFPEPKKELFTPPIMPEPKKDVIVPAPKKELFTPPPVPEVKKDLFVAPLPDVKKDNIAPTIIMPTSQPDRPAEPRMKSFVRVRPPGSEALVPLPESGPRSAPTPILIAPPGTGALQLQTASVTVEKRGAARLRTGETQTYQLIARNMGPVPAAQVRIEEELPSGVRLVSAEPMPVLEGNRVVWMVPLLNVNQEQILRVTLKAVNDTEIAHRVKVNVSASNESTVALRPRQLSEGLAVRVIGPGQTSVGKPVVFEIRVTNQTGQPIDGMILHGLLPEGLNTPEGRNIEGQVDGLFLPGQTKVVRMPASAVKPGRHTVRIKVTSKNGIEVVDSTTVDVGAGADGVLLQQAPLTQMLLGRDGDLRIEVTNHSDRPLKNVVVADRLPEEVDFVLASDRGFFQSNSRTVQWLIEQLPQGAKQTLYIRVHGNKAGQHPNVVTLRADGMNEIESPGVIRLDGSSELTMRVSNRDNVLEMGRETVYEIQLQNPGTLSASNVKVQVQFAPGLTPKKADVNSRCTIDRHTVTFEPIEAIGPQSQVILRVSALGQSLGDQRVRFSVISDQVRTPIQREISTIVVRD